MLQDWFKDMLGKSKRELVERALSRISDPKGEGSRIFTRVYDGAARESAVFADKMAEMGAESSPLAGIPISIKDLFDVKGEPTLAGSRVLANSEPATTDAVIVRRLRQAGAAIIGKTNMTEFAFSGLGINPHYGTPLNAWQRSEARIPGGSSSGAAISVTDGMAAAAIGTDTGGSVRIPAALNGLVGFKPSAQTVPTAGCLPLSPSFDSIGPIAASVGMCARIYAVLENIDHQILVPADLRRCTVGAVQNYVLDQMDVEVAAAYGKALQRLRAAGVTVREVSLPAVDRLHEIFTNGGIVGAEAYHRHRKLIDEHGDEYDPRVLTRIQRGKLSTASDYIEFLNKRRVLTDQWIQEISAFDALVMPTVPIIAPPIADLVSEDAYGKVNLLMLRNPTVINALNGCAISIPCHTRSEAPVGLTLASHNGRDWPLLSIAMACEQIL